jgi:hypothetical protein
MRLALDGTNECSVSGTQIRIYYLLGTQLSQAHCPKLQVVPGTAIGACLNNHGISEPALQYFASFVGIEVVGQVFVCEHTVEPGHDIFNLECNTREMNGTHKRTARLQRVDEQCSKV